MIEPLAGAAALPEARAPAAFVVVPAPVAALTFVAEAGFVGRLLSLQLFAVIAATIAAAVQTSSGPVSAVL